MLALEASEGNQWALLETNDPSVADRKGAMCRCKGRDGRERSELRTIASYFSTAWESALVDNPLNVPRNMAIRDS